MRAYRIEKFGSLDGLVTTEEQMPVPGVGEVLVRVRATSLNFRDLAIILGWYPFPFATGFIPLTDSAGEIEAVGPGVTRFKAGDRVVNAYFPNWVGGSQRRPMPQYGSERDGWLTEYKIVDAEALSIIPDHLGFEEAATLPCAAVTAWSALAGIGAGDTVLTEGTGGVSLFAVQLAKAMGARVIATTSNPAKAERLRTMGADATIDYVATPEWAGEVRALTGGLGADRIVEVGGAGTLAQSIKAVAYHGQVSMIGALAEGGAGIDYMAMFMSQATYKCIGVGSRSDLEDMNRVMSAHRLHPVIDSVFSLTDAKAAWAHFAGRQFFGKVVISH